MIRRKQMEEIRKVHLRVFVVEMITHLRAHFPDELDGMPDWELGEELLDCLERAAIYGITLRRDCARFLALATCFGWSFDTEMEWPVAMLRDPSISPSERLAQVHDRCLRRLEQEAQTAAMKRKLGV